MKSFLQKPKTLICGDLFAGAGGLSVGFCASGFEFAFHNEIAPDAVATLRHNNPSSHVFDCPIQDLNASVIKEKALRERSIDVMIGGPPCQGFSINAPERTQEDERNHLFRHYVRLVLEGLRPRVVLLENVPGLVSFDGGKTLAEVDKAFSMAGYKTAWKILNAAHYGVPQERWRLFMIGTTENIELSFPTPIHYSLQRANFSGGKTMIFDGAVKRDQSSLFSRHLLPPITVADAIGDLPKIDSGGGKQEMKYSTSASSDYQRSSRSNSKILWNHECSGLSDVNMKRIGFVRPGGSWRDIPHELLPPGMQRARRSDHTKRYGRLDPNGTSGTIMTKCDPHWGTVIHYKQDRIISVREAARFQSFPDNYRFFGSLVEQYRQVGNAVPPLLARAIAEHIKKLLSAENSAVMSTRGDEQCAQQARI